MNARAQMQPRAAGMKAIHSAEGLMRSRRRSPMHGVNSRVMTEVRM
jgi:hypothetical protein